MCKKANTSHPAHVSRGTLLQSAVRCEKRNVSNPNRVWKNINQTGCAIRWNRLGSGTVAGCQFMSNRSETAWWHVRFYVEVAGESSLKGFGCFSSDWPGFIVLSAFTHFYFWQYLWMLCCVAFTGCLSLDTASNGLVSKRLTPECLIVYALKQLADSWKILDSQHGKSRQENLIKLSGYLEIPHTHTYLNTNICMRMLTATWPAFLQMSRSDLKVHPRKLYMLILLKKTLGAKAESLNLNWCNNHHKNQMAQ